MTGAVVPGQTQYLPSQVVDVPKELFKNYPYSKRVGNYLMGRTLGEGSFAKVKEGLHIPTGQRIAVKIIDKRKTKSDSYVRRNLRREGKLLQQARHPNILQLYELMETENYYYLVTELCKGGDLMDYICQRKKIDEREVKRFIRQVVLAVDYLHRLGILHRDLKIENLLLDANKDIRIIDFGLSNSIRSPMAKDDLHSRDYCVTQCGSPAYAAPELLGQKKYGPQVDVWSIGVNMYAMLTGNLPFTADPFNIKALYNKMLNGQINPLPNTLSKECVDLIKQILCPDPEKRITITEILRHPWMCEGRNKPLERSPCPNKLCSDDLHNDVLKHMSENIGFRMSDVIRFVTSNVPSPATAMYHLLHRKLTMHYAETKLTESSSGESRLMESNKITVVMKDANSNESTVRRRFVFPTSTNKRNPYPSPPKTRIENDVNVMDLEEERPCPDETGLVVCRNTQSPSHQKRTSLPSEPKRTVPSTAHNGGATSTQPHARSVKKYVGDTALRTLQGDGSVRISNINGDSNNNRSSNDRQPCYQIRRKPIRKNAVYKSTPKRGSINPTKNYTGVVRTGPSSVSENSEERTFLNGKKPRFLSTNLKKYHKQENITPRRVSSQKQNAVHVYKSVIGDKVLSEITENGKPVESSKKSTDANSKQTLIDLRNIQNPQKYALRLTINDLDVRLSSDKLCVPDSRRFYSPKIASEVPELSAPSNPASNVTLPTLSPTGHHRNS